MSIQFPVVPQGNGVPAVQRDDTNTPDPDDDIVPVDGDGSDVSNTPPTEPQWGLFDASNNPVIVCDSIVALDYHKEANVPRYPMEGGAFQSYNKYIAPYDIVLRMTRGGTDADRSDFLNGLDTALNSLDLYTVVSPEKTYPNANVTATPYERTGERGVSLITADVHIVEIRDTATVAFSNTKQPQSQGQVDTGAVQGQTPDATQQAAVDVGSS